MKTTKAYSVCIISNSLFYEHQNTFNIVGLIFYKKFRKNYFQSVKANGTGLK